MSHRSRIAPPLGALRCSRPSRSIHLHSDLLTTQPAIIVHLDAATGNVLVCLAVIGMGSAALAAWWARWPRGARRLVPPPLPRDARAWRGAVVLMLALSLAFPLAAATIATVAAIDLLVVSRIRALRLLFE